MHFTSLPCLCLPLPAMAVEYDVGMPDFARKRLASQQLDEVRDVGGRATKAKASKVVAEAQQAAVKGKGKGGKGSSDKEVIEQLVVILTQLTLSNSAELREITGMLIVTHLVKADSAVAVASLQAGKDYQAQVEVLRKEKQDVLDRRAAGEDMVEDPEELGPPHVLIALDGIKAMINDMTLSTEVRKDLMLLWKDKIESKNLDTLLITLQVWKCRKPQTQGIKKKGKPAGGEYAKLQFSVSDMDIELLLCKALLSQGAVRKWGSAPRGWLERQAQQLLAKVRK